MKRGGFGAWQLMMAPLRRRKSRALLSLSALALGACLVTTLLTLYRGVETNLRGEFRRYGANLVVTPPAGAAVIALETAQSALTAVAPEATGVGVLYATGEATADADDAQTRPVVIAGTDVGAWRRMNSTWNLTGSQPAADEAWLGTNAARLLGIAAGGKIVVNAGHGNQIWRVAGTVESGGSEDNQVIAPYAQVAELTALDGFTTLQLRANGAAMASTIATLRAQLPGTQPQPIRQIAASEGAVLLSTHSLLLGASILILFTVGLCLTAALTTLALERRLDFGVMKALGASDTRVMLAFVGEAAVVGVAAAVAGAILGSGLAVEMGRALFGIPLFPTPAAVAITFLVTVGLAAVSALLPWPIVHGVSPAAILRGE